MHESVGTQQAAGLRHKCMSGKHEGWAAGPSCQNINIDGMYKIRLGNIGMWGPAFADITAFLFV